MKMNPDFAMSCMTLVRLTYSSLMTSSVQIENEMPTLVDYFED